MDLRKKKTDTSASTSSSSQIMNNTDIVDNSKAHSSSASDNLPMFAFPKGILKILSIDGRKAVFVDGELIQFVGEKLYNNKYCLPNDMDLSLLHWKLLKTIDLFFPQSRCLESSPCTFARVDRCLMKSVVINLTSEKRLNKLQDVIVPGRRCTYQFKSGILSSKLNCYCGTRNVYVIVPKNLSILKFVDKEFLNRKCNLNDRVVPESINYIVELGKFAHVQGTLLGTTIKPSSQRTTKIAWSNCQTDNATTTQSKAPTLKSPSNAKHLPMFSFPNGADKRVCIDGATGVFAGGVFIRFKNDATFEEKYKLKNDPYLRREEWKFLQTIDLFFPQSKCLESSPCEFVKVDNCVMRSVVIALTSGRPLKCLDEVIDYKNSCKVKFKKGILTSKIRCKCDYFDQCKIMPSNFSILKFINDKLLTSTTDMNERIRRQSSDFIWSLGRLAHLELSFESYGHLTSYDTPATYFEGTAFETQSLKSESIITTKPTLKRKVSATDKTISVDRKSSKKICSDETSSTKLSSVDVINDDESLKEHEEIEYIPGKKDAVNDKVMLHGENKTSDDNILKDRSEVFILPEPISHHPSQVNESYRMKSIDDKSIDKECLPLNSYQKVPRYDNVRKDSLGRPLNYPRPIPQFVNGRNTVYSTISSIVGRNEYDIFIKFRTGKPINNRSSNKSRTKKRNEVKQRNKRAKRFEKQLFLNTKKNKIPYSGTQVSVYDTAYDRILTGTARCLSPGKEYQWVIHLLEEVCDLYVSNERMKEIAKGTKESPSLKLFIGTVNFEDIPSDIEYQPDKK